MAWNKIDLETGGYFVTWIGVVFFAGYQVKLVSDDLFTEYDTVELSTGWRILGGKKKDTSDYDWEIITYTVYQQILWLCIHLIISEILKQIGYYRLLPFAQITITSIYILLTYNLPILLILLFQPVVFEVLSGLKRKTFIWLFEGVCFILLHLFKRCYHQRCIPFLYSYAHYNHHWLFMLSLYWTNLRCISYATSKMDNTIKKVGFIAILSYCLYLPLFSLGPFVDIHDFVKNYTKNKTTLFKRLITCCLNLTRFIFWWMVVEFLLHYIYSSFLSYYPMYVQNLDTWTLCGYGYCMGQFFHLKYVVSYGISTTLAKFENIPAPNTPKCIGRIHLYSDMWRYFDSGLYTFLRSYIYVPLKKMKLPSYLASFLSFCFVYVWHGLTKDVMVWAFLNYVCVTIESAFRHYYDKYLKQWCERTLSCNWRQRGVCMLAAPLLAVSAISNFYFFAGIDIGNIFFQNIFGGTTKSLCVLLFSLYCCCQISSYVKKQEELQDLTKKLK